ncbi:MAG: RNA 3'-terminal phosphate cyclase [Candidatus Anstonellaceae archaeon]
MIEIDGSYGEGGGQVLRTALSISCILGTPIKITNIRAGRKNPGLSYQHLAACNLLAKVCRAKIKGAEIGSKYLEFIPGKIASGSFKVEIGTAGSCSLLVQAALPVLLHAEEECTLEVIGGTHVQGAPTFEYLAEIFAKAASMFGAKFEIQLKKAGFYPTGGGKIHLKTLPSKLHGCIMQKVEEPLRYEIVYFGLPPHVAEREQAIIRKQLGYLSPSGKIMQVAADCAGNAVTMWKGFIGSCSIGKKGKMAEEVALEVCREFEQQYKGNACVDWHLADQLLLYAALAEGKSSFSAAQATQHLLTNRYVIEQMTGRNIIIEGNTIKVL